MESMTTGELNIREEFLKDAKRNLEEKLRLIDKLRDLPSDVPTFGVTIWEVDEDTGKGHSYSYFTASGDALTEEIFRPLIEQGLAEYRRRIEEKIQ